MMATSVLAVAVPELALTVAVASFAWLAVLLERARSQEPFHESLPSLSD